MNRIRLLVVGSVLSLALSAGSQQTAAIPDTQAAAVAPVDSI
jgi:hypothetical protein